MAGPYDRRLDDLLDLVNAGAMEPGAGTQAMWQLQDDRRAKRQERRAAQSAQSAGLQDTMGGFYDLAGAEAQQGTSLDSLGKLAGSDPGMAGLSPNMLSGLESLYFTNPESRNYGYSRLNPTLDPDDRAAILERVRSSGKRPFADLSREIHGEAVSGYGPKVYAQLAPQIDEVLREAWDFGAE